MSRASKRLAAAGGAAPVIETAGAAAAAPGALEPLASDRPASEVLAAAPELAAVDAGPDESLLETDATDWLIRAVRDLRARVVALEGRKQK